ncbi:MAG: FAD-dependent oxidoreductase, partial [Nitrospinota bacterium]
MITKPKYKVTLPDIEYYREQILCQWACPINTDAGRYVCETAACNYEEAYSTARAPNPLVYVLGRVCGHPCETACRRGNIDEPISIRALKRVATEHHDLSKGHNPKIGEVEKKKEKVAVVGSGPAGLSAAHDLSLMGYGVVIFESRSVAGGMLHLGIPEYRLPHDIIKNDIDAIEKLGVEIHLNKTLGKDFSLQDLKKEDFKAIFIAIGAHKSRDLQMEGVELDGVLKGVDFLLNVNLGYKVEMGNRVLIIGGGNVAVDVARSAVRQIKDIDSMSQEEMMKALKEAHDTVEDLTQVKEVDKDEMTTAVDVARSALRRGAKEVMMVCLESREEMPAHKEEIEEVLQEGIIILNSMGPRKIVGKAGKVT